MYFSTIKKYIPMGIEFDSFINNKLSTQYIYTPYMQLQSKIDWNSTGTSITKIDTFKYNTNGTLASEHITNNIGVTIEDIKYNYTKGIQTSINHYNKVGSLTEIDTVSYGRVTQVDTFKYNASGNKASEHIETSYGSTIGDITFNYTKGVLSSTSNYDSHGLLTSIDTIKNGAIVNHDITIGDGNVTIGLIGISHHIG